MGAVSRWRIELPPENNYFDIGYADRPGRPRSATRRGKAASRCAKRPSPPHDGICPATAGASSKCVTSSRTPGSNCATPRAKRAVTRGCGCVSNGRCSRSSHMVGRSRSKQWPSYSAPVSKTVTIGQGSKIARVPSAAETPPAKSKSGVVTMIAEMRIWSFAERARNGRSSIAGVFSAGIELGGRSKHAEIDIRFCDAVREIGPVFLLCRYTTSVCASPHPEVFSDPISWTDRPARLYRPRRLWGDRESERDFAIEGYPMGGRQISRL